MTRSLLAVGHKLLRAAAAAFARSLEHRSVLICLSHSVQFAGAAAAAVVLALTLLLLLRFHLHRIFCTSTLIFTLAVVSFLTHTLVFARLFLFSIASSSPHFFLPPPPTNLYILVAVGVVFRLLLPHFSSPLAKLTRSNVNGTAVVFAEGALGAQINNALSSHN